MGRRPKLKSEEFLIFTILGVEIITIVCLEPLKKVLHYSGARPHGCMAAWLCGCVAAWLNGCVAAWLHGCMAAWLRGCMAAWLRGCMAAWLCGCMAAWLRGCMAAWLRGCLCFPKRLAARLCSVAWLGRPRGALVPPMSAPRRFVMASAMHASRRKHAEPNRRSKILLEVNISKIPRLSLRPYHPGSPLPIRTPQLSRIESG